MSALDDYLEDEKIRLLNEQPPCEIPWLDKEYDFVCSEDVGATGCARCWNEAKKKGEKGMTFDKYQELAARTINPNLTDTDKLKHGLFGLASEVGELLGLFQKEYQGHSIEKSTS